MVFAGDVALGKSGMRLSIPKELSSKSWVINLEGSLVHNGAKYIPIHGVFNDYDIINQLSKAINVKLFSIANNHIQDAEPLDVTITNSKEIGIPCVGSGSNSSEASKSVDIDGYTLLSFGWECIECPQANSKRAGVNPYSKENVINSVQQNLSKGRKVICFMHWNYEFELFPQPYDRVLAHHLIDMGVYAVIGTHAHRVQHIEMYKGHPIVYGLGNTSDTVPLYLTV